MPGADTKLAASFSDRVFRVLWKSAITIEGGGKSPEKAIRVRSLALSFMAKCPTYTTLYMIQQVRRRCYHAGTSDVMSDGFLYVMTSVRQVYRVGVQFERSSKRSASEYRHIQSFYANAFDLIQQRGSLSTSHIFKVSFIRAA